MGITKEGLEEFMGLFHGMILPNIEDKETAWNKLKEIMSMVVIEYDLDQLSELLGKDGITAKVSKLIDEGILVKHDEKYIFTKTDQTTDFMNKKILQLSV